MSRTARHGCFWSGALLPALAAILLPAVGFAAQETAPFIPEAAKEGVAEGNAAFLKKDYAGARKAFEKVLGLMPESLVALVNLGLVEFYSGHPDRAEELLKRAVAVRLENPAAWLTLGMIYMDAEKFDEALAALSQAMVQDPRNARIRNFLGVVIGRKGWLDGAQSELRRAVELDPGYAEAHYNLAVFYLEEKPPAIELARRHYYRSVELGAEKDPAIEKVLNSSKGTQ